MAQSESDEAGRVTVGAKVSREKRRQFRKIAADHDTTMSTLLRRKIDEVIEEAEIAN